MAALVQRTLNRAQHRYFVVDINIAHMAQAEHLARISGQTAGHNNAFLQQDGAEFGVFHALRINQIGKGDGPAFWRGQQGKAQGLQSLLHGRW